MEESAKPLHGPYATSSSRRPSTLSVRRADPSRLRELSFFRAPRTTRRHLRGGCDKVRTGLSFLWHPTDQNRVRLCLKPLDYSRENPVSLFVFPYINIYMQMSKVKFNFSSHF